jgi:2-hydroxychromene-2-carboxylate isomerase
MHVCVHAVTLNCRIAKSLGLKLGFPPSHPFNPLLPLRVTVAIMEKDDPHLLKSAVASIFEACWMRSQDVTNEEVLLQVLRSVRGLNAEDALARAHTQPVKDTLRGLTEAAADAGVFGVPTFVVDDELFWGQDQVPFILDKLDGKDPFRGVDIDEIIRRPIAASRKIRTM